MYAVIAIAGKQYRVAQGERFVIDRVDAEEGATISPTVILASDGKKLLAGADEVAPVTVALKVREHTLGPKVSIRTYRPKKSYGRRMGHRQKQSVVEVESIAFGAKKGAKSDGA